LAIDGTLPFPSEDVSPARAVGSRAFPVFLICDAEDTTLPCRHAEKIYTPASGQNPCGLFPKPTIPRRWDINPTNSSGVC